MSKLLDLIIEQLKGAAVKAALVKLVKTSVGFRAWIIKILVEELFEEVIEPAIKMSFRRLKYEYDRKEGEIIVKKIDEARQNGNQADYDSSVDDIFR